MFQTKYPVDSSKGFKIILVSDLHIGLKGFRKDLFQTMLNDLKGKDTYWIGLGDYVEGRLFSHPFYNSDETEMDVGEQYAYFSKHMKPFANRCMGMVVGNHEESNIKATTMNRISDFCMDNDVTYLGNLGRTVLYNDEDVTLNILSMHGAGGGTIGAAINKAIAYSSGFDSDLVLLGHHHKFSYDVVPKAVVDELNNLSFQPRHVVITGALLDGYKNGSCSYSESKMMPPTIPGYVKITINDDMDIENIYFKTK